MEKSLSWSEFIITRLIKASGYSAILFVALPISRDAVDF